MENTNDILKTPVSDKQQLKDSVIRKRAFCPKCGEGVLGDENALCGLCARNGQDGQNVGSEVWRKVRAIIAWPWENGVYLQYRIDPPISDTNYSISELLRRWF